MLTGSLWPPGRPLPAAVGPRRRGQRPAPAPLPHGPAGRYKGMIERYYLDLAKITGYLAKMLPPTLSYKTNGN